MPREFSKYGIRFAYPDNWILDEQPVDSGNTVAVASPNGGFWWLSIYPAAIEVEDVAKSVLDGLTEEYDNADVDPAVEVIADQQTVGYDIDFVCLDLINTAQIRGFQNEIATFVMLWQAEDREFREIAPIFRAITTSLVQSSDQIDLEAASEI